MFVVGKSCEVNRDGCASSPCQHDGKCMSDDDLSFKCTCEPGFTGNKCQFNTTVSFKGDGYWLLDTYNLTQTNASIEINFITTLADVTLLLLELKGSNNNMIINLQNKELVIVTISNDNKKSLSPISYNNNKWHSMKLRKIENEWVLDLNGKQVTSLFSDELLSITIGGSKTQMKYLKPFTGCMRNIAVNDNMLVPTQNGTTSNIVTGRCNRKMVCDVNACNQRGACKDLWTSKKCKCDRQYYDNSCSQGNNS